MIVPFALIGLIDISGIATANSLVLPSLVALVATFRMSYEIARKALGVGGDVAVAFVALDFLVSLAIVLICNRLFGLTALPQ